MPGPVTEPLQEVAARLGVHVVFGTYERGPERGTVYNTAVLIGPDGDVLGAYRKTHSFSEDARAAAGSPPATRSWSSTPSSASIGLIICFDGDYPELSRIEAVRGAEVICRPSALLRSADIWELTNRARAYDNHVYVVGANATGTDPAGVLYFGNSMIVTPVAEVVARAASHECWVQRPARPGHRDGVADAGLERAAALRPPRRPQPRLDRAPPRRPAPPGRDAVPAPAARAMTARRRIRVGIDTGGTFTDVVALDEDSGELVATKTPSTPADPADGFLAGIRKVLAALGAAPRPSPRSSHGTTVATNQLLEGKVGDLGFITTEGYEHLLEIARQSVPDGYGNSYFWVKPPRIVPADRVRTVGGRLDHTGAEVRPFDEAGARAAARFCATGGSTTIGVCFLHAYANPAHERADARDARRASTPRPWSRISSEVLREYREYERAMTTLVDAAVKPRVAALRRRHRRAPRRLRPGPAGAVLRHEVQRRRALGRRGRAPADHHRAVRAGGRRARRRAGDPGRRLRPGAHPGRRRHLDRRERGPATASRR